MSVLHSTPTGTISPSAKWLARGLEVLILGTPKNLIVGQPQPTISGSIPSYVGPTGRYLNFGATSSILDTNWIPSTGTYTAILLYQTYGFPSSNGAMLVQNRKTGEASRAEIWLDNIFAVNRYRTVSEYIGGLASATYPDLPNSLVGVQQTLAVGGSSLNTSSSFILGSTYTGGVSGLGVDNSFLWSGALFGVALFNKDISRQEKQILSSNFCQLFTPAVANTPLFVTLSAPSGATASGNLVAVETGSDTAAFTGQTGIYGTVAATESGSDTAAFTGVSYVVGSLAVTESGSDTAAITGTVLAQGSLAATESGSDTAAFTGSSGTIAILAAVETGSNTASFSGVTLVSGTLAVTESGSDTAAVNGVSYVVGSLTVTESGPDTAAFTGGASTIGVLAAIETSADTASLGGLVLSQGTIAATETGSDIAIFTGITYVVGILAVTESGADVAAFSGGNPYVYIPSLRLMTSPVRTSTLITSPSRTVPTFNSITRSVTFTSPSRAILLASSPSRTVALSSPERSEVT